MSNNGLVQKKFFYFRNNILFETKGLFASSQIKTFASMKKHHLIFPLLVFLLTAQIQKMKNSIFLRSNLR